jgi:hypothetical protein
VIPHARKAAVPGMTAAASGMTASRATHTIGYVLSWTAQMPAARMLTKRRAVDFCRVATALCPYGPASRADARS